MASLIFNSFFEDLARGAIDLDTDIIKVMLVTSSYTENKDTHDKRNHINNEITGTGYTAGGVVVPITITKDNTNDRLDISLGQVSWAGASFTARKAVYYKSRGGAASADELIAVNDFGSDVTATGATFTLNASTLRIQN